MILGVAIAPATALYATEALVAPETAAAVTDTYPDGDAYNCKIPYGDYSWCKNNNPNSPRGYGYKNCTDWAAYRASQLNGISVPGNLGNATTWDDRAPSSWVVDTTPEVGDIAQNDTVAGGYGHVGVVEEVNKNTQGQITSITTSEYNHWSDGNFGTFTYNANNGSFSASWDHFLDLNGTGISANSSPAPTIPKDDFGIYRMEGGNAGTWYIKSSNVNNPQTAIWGAIHGSPGDIPVSADFDGDGYADFGVFRMEGSTGTWYVKSSSNGGHTAIWGATHGSPGDIPVVGDFNGDGYADFGVYRSGTWYVKSGADGSHTAIWGAVHGGSGDIPVVGDFNHDHIADFGIYRMVGSTGTWYVKSGATGQDILSAWGVQQGSPGDVPVAGDFNGDGYADFGVYRVENGTDGTWYVRSGVDVSSMIVNGVVHGGQAGDIPFAGNED